MESRVSDLENQLEEKADEVHALRERIEALEAGKGGRAVGVTKPQEVAVAAVESSPQGSKVPKMVPGLSLGGGDKAETKPVPAVSGMKAPSKIGSRSIETVTFNFHRN